MESSLQIRFWLALGVLIALILSFGPIRVIKADTASTTASTSTLDVTPASEELSLGAQDSEATSTSIMSVSSTSISLEIASSTNITNEIAPSMDIGASSSVQIATSTSPNKPIDTVVSSTDSSISRPAASAAVLNVTPDIPAAASTTSVTCDMAYTGDLYDTPSGHLDKGYVDVARAGTSTVQIAHKIGTQSWAVCKDYLGHQYEVKLLPEEYKSLSSPGGAMPRGVIVPLAQ